MTSKNMEDNTHGDPQADTEGGEGEAPIPKQPQKDFEQIAADQRRRAEKAEDEARVAKEELAKYKPVEAKEDSEKPSSDFDNIINIAHATRDLTSDEVVELKKLAKGLQVNPESLVTSEIWGSHLMRMRAEQPEETLEPTSRASVRTRKTFSETVASEDASDKDRQSAFEAKRDEILSKRR